MKYQAELHFLMKALEKMNIPVSLLSPDNLQDQWTDMGLRKCLGMEDAYEKALLHLAGCMRPRTIHKLTDEFRCNYFSLRLPDTAEVYLVIGPYVTVPMTREQLMEQVERFHAPSWRFVQFERCFSGIPVIRDDSALFAMLNAFGETIWGRGKAFEFADMSMEALLTSVPTPSEDGLQDPETQALQMRAMEKRYHYENELMDYVAHGLTSRAERMVRNFTMASMDPRTGDPVKNVKYYCCVCNTLLRKAAEKGGVHPMQLDHYSAALARRSETISDPQEGAEVMQEMVRTYCRLVRKHTVGKYPPLVQKTLTYIDANLSGDLRLQVLAEAQNVSGSYLSALFHREFGKTLTECIMEKRIENAAGLLLTTHLQVQTVAQHCGFSDVNYFSKVFKKTYGMTPRQYRQQRPEGL